METNLPDIVRVLGVLSDPGRLIVMGQLLAAEPDGLMLTEVGQRAGLDERRLQRSLGPLLAGGLVVKGVNGHLHAEVGPIRDAASAALALTPIGRVLGEYPRLAGCIANGTIVQIPADLRLKRELAAMVLRVIDLAEPIPEARLNELLQPLGGDPANLRRLLIDEGLLTRDPHAGVYSVSNERCSRR